MAKKQHVQPPCQWLMAQNASIVESVVAGNAFHFAKLKTYKYVVQQLIYSGVPITIQVLLYTNKDVSEFDETRNQWLRNL